MKLHMRIILLTAAIIAGFATGYHGARLSIAEERAGEARMLAAQAHERIDWLRGRLAELEAEVRP